jgi:hypothetical protein
MTTSIKTGIAINKLRKLQANYDYWLQYRPPYPFVPATWREEMANKQIETLGPAIVALQRQIAMEAAR